MLAVELGQIVGAGLLAKAVYQLQISWLTHRIREQARSHIWISIHQTESVPLCFCTAFASTTQFGYQAAVLLLLI
ncbi:hypothetical protein A7J50_0968 [Pseudomonas antarctica]|uniref:Uncharacterized protein n=1 Tax=Pseudomonas antarctica TaxID=219572 RepID=A0A172YXA4_9PSED|nr:hypothetical protein [Pseudomonas antarctica]ANF84409.1 hypothetical protein A7J50_0968 [Pseudomonas antarctica]